MFEKLVVDIVGATRSILLWSPCFLWRLIHRRWWIIRRKIPYGCYCLVELVEEIDVLAVFEVVAVCKELDVLYDGAIILSLCFSQSNWFFRVFNPGKHCFSFNWIESTSSDTGIWFLHRWIIRVRDESARLRVWNIFSDFNFWISFFFSNEMLTIFGWSHVRLTTIGALKTDCVYPSKQWILNTGINSEQTVHTKIAITGPWIINTCICNDFKPNSTYRQEVLIKCEIATYSMLNYKLWLIINHPILEKN